MTGLILKDFFILRKTIRSYAIFLVFYLILGIMGIFPTATVTVVIQMITMMLPLSAFAYDEQAKWEQYALTFPTGRRSLVSARYAFSLSISAIASVFGLAACILLPMFAREGSLIENLGSLAVSMGLGFLMADVLIPLCYKLGVERARPYMYLLLFAPTVLIIGAYQFGLFRQINFNAIEHLPSGVLAAIVLLIVLLPLLGMLPSYLISCRIMDKKEF